jgi:RsmE family RNA methyltransferase
LLIAHCSFALSDSRAAHILRVLHKTVGDPFEAGIVGGAAGVATVTGIDGGVLRFTFSPQSDGRPLYPLTMIVGFVRPIQLRRLFRDMAALGVLSLHLCGTDLGEPSYRDSTVVTGGAAERLLLEGAAQAKSTHAPALFVHGSLRAALDAVGSGESVRVGCDNVRSVVSLTQFLQVHGKGQSALCAIGSERGWTEGERDLLEERGFTLCGLGERVLRTETAATVAGTIILANLGVL